MPTREALDYEANSPHQYLRECIGNSMMNLHTDVRVGRDKALKFTSFYPFTVEEYAPNF